MKNFSLILLSSIILFSCNSKTGNEDETNNEENLLNEKLAFEEVQQYDTLSNLAVKLDASGLKLNVFAPEINKDCDQEGSMKFSTVWDKNSVLISYKNNKIIVSPGKIQTSGSGKKICEVNNSDAGAKLYKKEGADNLFIIGEDDIRDATINNGVGADLFSSEVYLQIEKKVSDVGGMPNSTFFLYIYSKEFIDATQTYFPLCN